MAYNSCNISGFLIRAALKGAHIALLRKKQGLQVLSKDSGGEAGSGAVTNGDLQSEQVIIADLLQAIPQIKEILGISSDVQISFISEEDHLHNYADRKKGYYFVIDPIDGTLNYTGKSPKPNPWCVSIGFEKDGATIAAVAYEAGCYEYRESLINPSRPSGKVYWAEEGIDDAHVIDGGGNKLSVRPHNPDTVSYDETDGDVNVARKLVNIPELVVDYTQAPTYRLTVDTRIANSAKVEIDGFMPDIEESARLGDSQLKYNGPVISNLKWAIANLGYDTHISYSNVSGGLAAADGRAAGYICGRGQPWDHSAIRLIIAKAGVNIIEYHVPGHIDKRSVIIASRNRALFDKSNTTLQEIEGAIGLPFLQDTGGKVL